MSGLQMSGSLCLTSFIHSLFLQPILVSRHCANARHTVMGKTWPSPGPHGGMSGRRGNGSLENNQTSKGKCVNQHKYSDKKTHGSQARDQLMGLWVPHTVGAQTNRLCTETTTKTNTRKASPARRQACTSRPAAEAGVVFSSVPRGLCLTSLGNVVLETGYRNARAHFIPGRKI